MRELNSIEMIQVSAGCPSYEDLYNVTDLQNGVQHLVEIDILKGKVEWRPEEGWGQNLKELALIGGLLAISIIVNRVIRSIRLF